jgi:hypothetical protein
VPLHGCMASTGIKQHRTPSVRPAFLQRERTSARLRSRKQGDRGRTLAALDLVATAIQGIYFSSKVQVYLQQGCVIFFPLFLSFNEGRCFQKSLAAEGWGGMGRPDNFWKFEGPVHNCRGSTHVAI